MHYLFYEHFFLCNSQGDSLKTNFTMEHRAISCLILALFIKEREKNILMCGWVQEMMMSDDKVGGWFKKGQNHDDVILECPLADVKRDFMQ